MGNEDRRSPLLKVTLGKQKEREFQNGYTDTLKFTETGDSIICHINLIKYLSSAGTIAEYMIVLNRLDNGWREQQENLNYATKALV